MLSFWIFIFVISLVLLVKGADWFLAGAEKIGLAAGLSPFVVGLLIVGMGTSFPELVSAFAAIMNNVSEIVPANAVGSNITNILLVVGFAAIFGRRIVVSKDLIDLDLPLLSVSTVLLLGVLWDKQVTFWEAALLVIMYVVYIAYTTLYSRKEFREKISRAFLPARAERRKLLLVARKAFVEKIKVVWKDLLFLLIGLGALLVGAKYLIDSVIELSGILGIGAGVISIVAISFGTSLPELVVASKAAFKKKYDVILGTIFGSNVFNALIVVGLPGLFANLSVDEKTFSIGLPVMALATLLFVISGISKRIHMWEGMFYVSLYILFIAKIFEVF
jgi:cation:H+ antiporter